MQIGVPASTWDTPGGDLGFRGVTLLMGMDILIIIMGGVTHIMDMVTHIMDMVTHITVMVVAATMAIAVTTTVMIKTQPTTVTVDRVHQQEDTAMWTVLRAKHLANVTKPGLELKTPMESRQTAGVVQPFQLRAVAFQPHGVIFPLIIQKAV
jgi:hypothetical protein